MATADELIWQAIGPPGATFCAFKVKTVTQNFCRNQYNVSGLCSRQSCPLANSKYATVREQEGSLYLFMKTAERAHTPAKMWERVKLSNDYAKALEQIDSELQYWPSFLIHKCKQRTTKIVQYLIKMRKLRTQETGKLVPVKRKLERRERAREGKALIAAKLEKNLEKELIARLKSRAYGDLPLNVNEDVWNKILEKERLESEKEGELALEFEEDEDDFDSDDLLEEDEEEGEFDDEREFVEDLEESEDDMEDYDEDDEEQDDDDDDDEEEDSEQDADDGEEEDESARRKGKRRAPEPRKPAKKARRGGAAIEVEYEMEGPATQTLRA